MAVQVLGMQVVGEKASEAPAGAPTIRGSSADAAVAAVQTAVPPRPAATASVPPRPTSGAPKRPPRPGAANGSAHASDPIPATEPMPLAPVSQSPRAANVGIVVPDDHVPPPPLPPRPSAQALSDTHQAALPATSPAVVVPPGTAGTSANELASARPTQPSMESASLPNFTLVRKREEEPRPDAPITYREYAYAVDPSTDRKAAEVLLWQRFRELAQQIAGRPKGKFIQLAVFDHVFEKRPLRAPIASLAWKDWRGDPVVQFSADIAPSSKPVPVPSYPPPAVPAPVVAQPVPAPVVAQPVPAPVIAQPVPAPVIAQPVPAPVVAQPISAPVIAQPIVAAAAAQPVPAPAVAQSAAVVEEPAPISQSVSIEIGGEIAVDSSDLRSERPNVVEALAAAASQALVPDPAAPAPQAPVPDPTAQPAPNAAFPQPASGNFAAAAAAPGLAPSEPKPAQRSDPIIRRRRLGEDLISQLFESMHELHFMRDIVSGAEFVLGVLNDTLPCELTLIHVFDINTGQFVLVRANGPGSDKLVLFRTPDQDPLFSQAMRRLHAVRVDDAAADERFTGGRWGVIALEPRQALCGGVKQGGRYLGAIELINPGGGETFYESEANALDYICEQFAEFLTNRPIVLDAEVVLSKG
jgi:hypothetical protein